MDNKYLLKFTMSNGTQIEAGEIVAPQGEAGTSVGIDNIIASDVSLGLNYIYFSDGKTLIVRNGKDGDKGDPGKPFRVEKVYTTVAAMNEGFSTDGVPEGGFVVIQSSVEDEDNARLYVKGANSYSFLVDLSGAQGMKGKDGTSVTITKIESSSDSGGVSTITFSDGTTMVVHNGTDGAQGGKGDNGNDGTSLTHSWNGTNLIITSKSGSSSANLKGATGVGVVSATLVKV